MKPTERIVCDVQVERILYPRTAFSPGGFAIAACEITDLIEGEPYNPTHIVIKGKVFSLNPGTKYRMTGIYSMEEKYGCSYKVESFEEHYNLDDEDDRDNYLKTILSPTQYDLVHKNLKNPFETIQQRDVETLKNIKGVGKSTAQNIVNKFHARLDQAKAFSRLGKYGLSVEAIASLLNRVSSADELVNMIEENPYIMIDTVDGIGWARADAIAMKKGISPQDPRRVKAYVIHFMNCQAEAGHTWCYPQDLWDALSYDLKLEDQEPLRKALQDLYQDDKIWWGDSKDKIALKYLYELEYKIAEDLLRLASSEPLQVSIDPDKAIADMEEESGWKFTDEQKQAIHGTLKNNVSIITGAAGTGKSSAVKGVLQVLKGKHFAQCALSGRAAARLTEVTGVTGSTIHRLLGYQPGLGFAYNRSNPLPYDIIILDEVSMVGAEIFAKLIEAIPTGSKLIMLGDDGQLESIGLCNLFRDMLDSGVITIGRLTKIHRQAAKSAIITQSMKVRNQEPLCDADWVGKEVRGDLKDLLLEVYSSPLLTRDNIVDNYKALIESGVSRHSIQIVVPMKTRGDACTLRINKDVQNYINAENHDTSILIGKEDESTSYELRLNDRVICTKNMYDAERPLKAGEDEPEHCAVYNGDRGVITFISYDKSFIIIKFDLWGEIEIPRSKLSHIELGYALSCHKLQGSEADFVIVGFDMSSARLLTKEWLYTAITRAKKYCVLTAENRALRYCIATSNVPYKRTFLRELLLQQPWRKKEAANENQP